jgi:hypothetical protein
MTLAYITPQRMAAQRYHRASVRPDKAHAPIAGNGHTVSRGLSVCAPDRHSVPWRPARSGVSHRQRGIGSARRQKTRKAAGETISARTGGAADIALARVFVLNQKPGRSRRRLGRVSHSTDVVVAGNPIDLDRADG